MCKFCLRQKRIVAHFVRWKLIPIPFLVCSVHRQYRSSLLELSKFIKFVLWIDLWPSAGSKWSLSCEQLRILLLLRKSLCLSLTVVPWQTCPRTTTFSSFITFLRSSEKKRKFSWADLNARMVGGGGEKLKQGECGHRYTMPSYTIRSISLVLVGVKSAKAFYSLYFQVQGTKTQK